MIRPPVLALIVLVVTWPGIVRAGPVTMVVRAGAVDRRATPIQIVIPAQRFAPP